MQDLDLVIHVQTILKSLWVLQQSRADIPELNASYKMLEHLNQQLLNKDSKQ